MVASTHRMATIILSQNSSYPNPKRNLKMEPAAETASTSERNCHSRDYRRMLADPRLFAVHKLAKSTSFSQPLLWYRLLRMLLTRRNSWRSCDSVTPWCYGCFGSCVPIVGNCIGPEAGNSCNIHGFPGNGSSSQRENRGGNNLHNLDMFLVTLSLSFWIALRERTSLISGNQPLV